ncbi:MAG: hypothetical protein KAS04_06275 [Candidatus Aenigmarchaeota archaeon]|nr:hypothetical protein [Candidatus Aenigmarchaeota archaeon]
MGRITKLNAKEKRELKKLFLEKDIRYCEARISQNCSPMSISFAHRHKKHWYLGKPDELRWAYEQVIGACIPCHQELEFDRELTEETFLRLR